MEKNQKKSQNLVEYLLIFAMVAIVSYGFVAKINLKTIKNYVFDRPADTTDPTKIKIEAMTP